MIPELTVTDFAASIDFYTQVLGFLIEYQREEEGFAMLTLGDSKLMIDQMDRGRTWKTGDLEYPLGRGINFQIPVKDIESLLQRLKDRQVDLFMEVEEKWYRKDQAEVGQKQFLVQDPDGYLLRFVEDLGERQI